MAAPASYTEDTLATFMLRELSNVAAALGWSTTLDVQRAIDETLIDYGTDTIATVTGRDSIRKLRVLARLHAWRIATEATASDYNFSADGGTYSRAQVHEQCKAMLARAESEAMMFDDSRYAAILEPAQPAYSLLAVIDGTGEWT